MIQRETNGAHKFIEDGVHFTVESDHIAIEVAVPICQVPEVSQQVGLQRNAGLVIVQILRQIDFHHLIMRCADGTSGLYDDNVGTGKSFQKLQRSRQPRNMDIANDGEHECTFRWTRAHPRHSPSPLVA